jgi:hypothetical protein
LRKLMLVVEYEYIREDVERRNGLCSSDVGGDSSRIDRRSSHERRDTGLPSEEAVVDR